MVLRVSRLSVDIESADGRFPVVDQVGFELHRSKTLALVGESGSGKSLTALAIMRLLPAGARVAAGETWLGTTNLLGQPASAMRDIRGVRIGMIFQEPMTCLNPVMSIGQQVAEPLRVHHRMSRRQAWRRATEMLERVGLTPGGRCARRYPHELSGGMRQRAMIAMALICGPEVLIADEPTTALDVTIQRQILELLRELQDATGVAILLITHDLPLAAEFAHEVAVMYAGRLVETAPVSELFRDPLHPYTKALLASAPRIDAAPARMRLPTIPGEPPHPANRPCGCAFHPRCAEAADDVRCQTEIPHSKPCDSRRTVACWRATHTATEHATV